MMGKSVAIIKQLSPEEKAQALKERLAEAKFIERDALSAEYAAGMAEGIAEGKAEFREKLASYMRNKGKSEEEITRVMEKLDSISL